MKILLFETTIYGHYLEYTHHIYEGLEKYTNVELYLVVPLEFEKEKDKYSWSETDRVHIVYVPDDEIQRTKNGSIVYGSWKRAKLLSKYVKVIRPDAVFLISLAPFMPFLPLMILSNVKIYGIIYKLYTYRWAKMTTIRKFFEIVYYKYMVRAKAIKGIFILNDNSSTCYFNRKHKTNKFIYLPDPFNKIPYKARSLREDYNIKGSDIVYLHFGAMAGRKGTIEILDAIISMSETEKENKVFIFAGNIMDDIKTLFYEKYDMANRNCRVLLFEGFCTNELLADLCFTADCILCPYKWTDLSSGALGYAAAYGKPVIGPSDGLIGKLIRKYDLGKRLSEINATQIKTAIVDISKDENHSNYIQAMSIDNFVDVLFNTMIHN